jgi:hypothetical protein
MTGDREDTHRLLRQIERDFDALAGLLDRAITQLADDDTAVKALTPAKQAAARGRNFRPPKFVRNVTAVAKQKGSGRACHDSACSS